MCSWAVFLAEMKSASLGSVVSPSFLISSRVRLAFSSRTSLLRSLKEAVGSSCGGVILTILVCARHLAVATVGSFCQAVSAYVKAWDGGWGNAV